MLSLQLLVASMALTYSLTPPNVVVVVVDDMGWANIGYHNKEHTLTPTMNELAASGVTLNRHYGFFYCSPTRSAFLSGRLPYHVNQYNPSGSLIGGGIPIGMTLLSEKLRTGASYHTHQIGKWHLGMATDSHLPVSRGFNTSFGYLSGAEDHWTNLNRAGDGRRYHCGTGTDMWRTHKPAYGENATQYSAFAWTSEATKIISEHNPERLLFMYVALQNMHAPNEVPTEYSNKFKNYTQDYAIYNGMGNCADESVHNITTALKQKGLWNNTLFVLFADNGGPASTAVSGHMGNNYPLRGGKRTNWEGGIRTNAFVTGGDKVIPNHIRGTTVDSYFHVCDWYSTICHLAGVDPTDDVDGLPGIDSINQWSMLQGTASNLRDELPIMMLEREGSFQGSLIKGDYKLLFGQQDYDTWQGPIYPNASGPIKAVPVDCGQTGCLFNIQEDPTEHNNLNETMPEKAKELWQRVLQLNQTRLKFNRGKEHPIKSCDAKDNRYGGFWGPYQKYRP